jgi:hypothetical protein
MATIDTRPDLPGGPPSYADQLAYMRLGEMVADRVALLLGLLPEASQLRLVPRIWQVFADAGVPVLELTLVHDPNPATQRRTTLLTNLRLAASETNLYGQDFGAKAERLLRALASVEQLVAAEVLRLDGGSARAEQGPHG